MANEYESIKTKVQLDELKLSYTMREVRDKWNANMDELDDRADAADAKFEAIEEKLDTIETDATKVEPSQTNGNIIINGTETPVYRLPQLTPRDVGADPAGTAASVVSTHDSDQSAHTYIQGLVSTAQQKADDAYALAEGRENATSYTNYQSMVAALNAESSATLKVGDNIYVETVGVPDLWVSDVLDSKASYTYTTDQAIVDALNDPSIGYVNIGWYRLSELETAKVDLSGYVEKAITVTGTGALGGGGALSQNRTITHNSIYDPNSSEANNRATFKYREIKIDKYGHVSAYSDAVSQAAAKDGTTLTLVTTGEKYNWNGAITALSDKLDKANPTGTGYLALNNNKTVTPGTYSVAVGHDTSAAGNSAFAEGEGTTASGGFSHAEGNDTTASGSNSHAEGLHTTANHNSQHVFGMYNEADASTAPLSQRGNYVEIVGNGTGPDLSYKYTTVTPSNARTLDWDGNEVLAGNIKLGNHTTLANNSSSDITVTLPSSAGTLATETYVDTAVGAIDTKKAFTFTATDARWSSQADADGMYVCTFNSSNTTGFKTSYIPLSCFNSNNEQVVATLAFDHTSGSECVKIKSDTKFPGTIYMI